MQSNISVGANGVTGTLKYVSGYTGFGGDPDEQAGNYIVLHFESEDADSITIELIGDVSGRGEITLDSDGILIARISNTSQKIKVRAYKDDSVANTHTISLSGLTLEEE